MSDPKHNADLRGEAERYAEAVMEAFGALRSAGGTHDTRVVVLACAQVAGSFAFGLADPELKRALVRHWVETFIQYAGEPLRVVEEQ